MLQLAVHQDWSAVCALSRYVHTTYVQWRPDIYCVTDEPYTLEMFLEDISKRVVYVAKMEETVVGFVRLSIREINSTGLIQKKQMCLESISVEEALRGHGVGRTMLQEVRLLAKVFGCQELVLAVYPENDGAVSFFQKCGFFIRSVTMDMRL